MSKTYVMKLNLNKAIEIISLATTVKQTELLLKFEKLQFKNKMVENTVKEIIGYHFMYDGVIDEPPKTYTKKITIDGVHFDYVNYWHDAKGRKLQRAKVFDKYVELSKALRFLGVVTIIYFSEKTNDETVVLIVSSIDYNYYKPQNK